MGANLKEVRERIQSVVSTQQITKAMKMVSAAKLRRAQESIVKLRPYAMKLSEIMTHIVSHVDIDRSSDYGKDRDVNKVLIVVVTSNRGLAGAFNTNIIKAARQLMEDKYQSQYQAGNVHLLCIGKKGFDFFRRRLPESHLDKRYVNLFADLTFDQIVEVPDLLMQYYRAGAYDAIEVCYGRFKNAAVQFAEAERYLPVLRLDLVPGKKRRRADYLFEPGQEELLRQLVPNILQTQFYRYLLDTHASEHGARMTAMEKATENAEDLLRELKISYNKARQEAITSELSEIVGGAVALAG